MSRLDEFEKELTSLINRFGLENYSHTPDFILARYMVSCLESFEAGSLSRESWYGKHLRIGDKDASGN